MSALVWDIRKRHGWASMRGVPNDLVFDVCHVKQVDNGLWVGEYIAGTNYLDYTRFPGEYPLEELTAALETTIILTLRSSVDGI